MANDVSSIIQKMEKSPKSVKFSQLVKVCEFYFGAPRQKGTSHQIYKTPWAGDPRINIQNNNGMAKVYQIKQVLLAIRKLEDSKNA